MLRVKCLDTKSPSLFSSCKTDLLLTPCTYAWIKATHLYMLLNKEAYSTLLQSFIDISNLLVDI